ncbi:MAG: hypothetical protein JWR80_4763 [Bradyrhizobium sp.]|nr:hypothetical protein [Bradyrhizobium sp.]
MASQPHTLEPTNPQQCILLLALPTTREEFISDYGAWPEKDFARFSAGTDDPGEAWDRHGVHLSEAIAKLVECATQAGVTVVPRATANDLERAFAPDKTTVALVAHWRGSNLRERDINCEPHDILNDPAWGATSALTPNVIEEVTSRVTAALDELPKDNHRERAAYFAGSLNKRLIQAEPLIRGLITQSNDEHLVISDLWLETLHRDALDLCAGGQIIPGNCLEMSDGLYGAAAASRLVPDSWSGTVDLGVCRSILLGHRIKQGRMDRIVIGKQTTVDPSVTLMVMRCVIDRLDGRSNYVELYSRCFQQVARYVSEISETK